MKQFLAICLLFILPIFLLSCSSDGEEPLPEPDTVAPEVDFLISGNSNPTDSAPMVVSTKMEINIDAKDAGGIAKVEAFIDGQKYGEDTTPPYQIVVDVSGFNSKGSQTNKFTDYILTITVTDTSGNQSSKDQVIHIDNEAPSITGVSLVNGRILGGETNLVTFDISDNEGLSSVVVFVNNVAITENLEGAYEVNLNTLELEDGEHVLKIEGKDLALNSTIHETLFLVDNTGPEILSNTVGDGQILDELISINANITDQFSPIIAISVDLEDQNLFTSDTAAAVDFEFDPEAFPAGEHNLRFTATDSLSNTTVLDIPVQIKRLLVKIDFPENFLSDVQGNHFVFASEMDGEPLDTKEVLFVTRTIRLHAPGEFDKERNFILTFASLVGPTRTNSQLYSIANLNRVLPGILEMETPLRFVGNGSTPLVVNGFSDYSELHSYGRDYNFSSAEDGSLLLTTLIPQNHSTATEKNYIYSFNTLNNDYRYLAAQKPVPQGFELNYEAFTQEGVESRSIDFMELLGERSTTLSIHGYYSEEEFENGLFHEIWSYGYGAHTLAASYPYSLTGTFHAYSHEFRFDNYRSWGPGLPPDQLTRPAWSVDYTYANNQIALNLSGSGHILGRALLSGGYDLGKPYEWVLEFDSQTQTMVLPKIPDALSNYPIYDHSQNSGFDLSHVELIAVEGIGTYPEFITGVVKQNLEFKHTALGYQSIFKSEIDGYQKFTPRSYFYNE